MIQIKAMQKRLCAVLCNIHLVDKCLLILMVLLLVQSAYILLTNSGGQTEANHIDIIIRTSSASIFGYFLSANFVQRNGQPGKATNSPKTKTSSLEVENGANTAPQSDGQDAGQSCSRLQIITATGIALFCLLALILVRDAAKENQPVSASTVAVATQFRDFVSSCVGFLIGCPTNTGNDK